MLKHRLLPTTESDRKNILQHCGVRSIEDLLQGIPKNIRYKSNLQIGEELSELEIKRKISKMTKSEVDEQTRRKFINDKIHKVIDHKSIKDDYNNWCEKFLLKFPPLES